VTSSATALMTGEISSISWSVESMGMKIWRKESSLSLSLESTAASERGGVRSQEETEREGQTEESSDLHLQEVWTHDGKSGIERAGREQEEEEEEGGESQREEQCTCSL
jgi:hypothetical protein